MNIKKKYFAGRPKLKMKTEKHQIKNITISNITKIIKFVETKTPTIKANSLKSI